ncbi:MAG: hypothetical protein SVM79_01985 [Chloroflexota bacterium]|nr:hypothetical protein [Chloroflexota bacterium]
MKTNLNRIPWLVLLALLLVGCSASAENSAQTTTPTTALVEVSDALRRDAEKMAEQMGISVDEALRRLKLQNPIGILGAELERQEADTFAGLWIQHEPEYRIIVAFTRDGERTIRPYIEDSPIAGQVEVRTAEATYEELKSAQREAHRLLDEVGLSVDSGINVMENQVELLVTDRPMFDTTLEEADMQLPDHVEAITVYEPIGGDIPFDVNPDTTIHFPQLKTRSASFMTAMLTGELVLEDGFLRVRASDDDEGNLIIWQTDYFLHSNEGVIEILDRNGQVVGRVGEEVCMGGGEVSMTASFERQLREPLPEHCEGPYWLQGGGMRLSLNYSSDLFTLEVLSSDDRTLHFLRKKPVLDDWTASMEETFYGELVRLRGRFMAIRKAYDPMNPKPATYVPSGTAFIPLWPPDYQARIQNGKFEIMDGSGQVVAREGEKVRLEGGKLKGWSSENYRQLYHELPCGCRGPYWVVKD